MSRILQIAPRVQSLVEDDTQFLLRIVQPGLVGLMDGSVSTLAPIFATAFVTHNSHTAFLIGAAAAVGAGISMAFSEALSDDGILTGRGSPIMRGTVTGTSDISRRLSAYASLSHPQRSRRSSLGLSGCWV